MILRTERKPAVKEPPKKQKPVEEPEQRPPAKEPPKKPTREKLCGFPISRRRLETRG
jgi:hypothetical protein